MQSVKIVEADLDRPEHQAAVVELVDAFALQSTGKPLSFDARRALVPGLREYPTTMIFLAFLGEKAIGIAVCFRGFSTFAARPLINIHDLVVLPEHRGGGVGRLLLEAVEAKARELGCCKLTLEVNEKNEGARRLYKTAGFSGAAGGGSLFLSKTLP